MISARVLIPGHFTFPQHETARMVEQEVLEVIAVGIDAGLLAQAGGTEKLERLQRLQSRLALGDGDRAAGDCMSHSERRTPKVAWNGSYIKMGMDIAYNYISSII